MLEIERKYEADDELVVPDLASVAGVATVTDPVEHLLTATYFDTPDHRLATWGVTVRRRVGGGDEGWHLKLPSATEEGDRHEIGVPLARAKRTVPKPFRATLAGLVGDQDLVPVATLTTHRTLRELRDVAGQVLAEVVDDRVEARPAGAESEEPVTWREIEVELVDGDDSVLDGAEERLKEAGARPSVRRSKLELFLPSPDRVDPLAPTRPRDRVEQLLHDRLASQLHELLLRDPLARENLPEGVHTMRVAVRRLRSVLATGRPFFDRSISEPLRDELSWLSDALGEARDAEMQRERLEEAIDALVEERRDLDWEPRLVRPELLGPLAVRQEVAVAALRDVLAGDRYARLLDRLREVVADPPWTAKADKRIRGAYRRRLAHELRRLEQRMESAEGEGLGPEERNTALHEARKAVKRARYAAEPLRPVYGAPAQRLVRRLKKLQSRLGEHQDTVVTREYLHGLTRSGHPPLDPPATLVAGALIERESRDAERYDEEAAATWRKVTAATSLLS
jgi:CHAD domain-containing protein